jgi:hypothetical protein
MQFKSYSTFGKGQGIPIVCLPGCCLYVSMHPFDRATGHLKIVLGFLCLPAIAEMFPKFEENTSLCI